MPQLLRWKNTRKQIQERQLVSFHTTGIKVNETLINQIVRRYVWSENIIFSSAFVSVGSVLYFINRTKKSLKSKSIG